MLLFTYIDDSGHRSKTKCLLAPSPTDTWANLTEEWEKYEVRKVVMKFDKKIKNSTNNELEQIICMEGGKSTQKYQQGDAKEDGCMSPLVPTPRSHLNCYSNKLLKVSDRSHG